MCSKNVIFDEENMVWGQLNQQEPYDSTMFGRMILTALSKYGSQLAQVNCVEIRFRFLFHSNQSNA